MSKTTICEDKTITFLCALTNKRYSCEIMTIAPIERDGAFPSQISIKFVKEKKKSRFVHGLRLINRKMFRDLMRKGTHQVKWLMLVIVNG